MLCAHSLETHVLDETKNHMNLPKARRGSYTFIPEPESLSTFGARLCGNSFCPFGAYVLYGLCGMLSELSLHPPLWLDCQHKEGSIHSFGVEDVYRISNHKCHG